MKIRSSILDTESTIGYKQITTFFEDFTMADCFGTSAIKQTFQDGLLFARTDYKIFTEFVMVLNWKCNIWFEDNIEYSELYGQLYFKADEMFFELFKSEEAIDYYFRTTDWTKSRFNPGLTFNQNTDIYILI